MGTGGQQMLKSNSANRKLIRSRFSKFSRYQKPTSFSTSEQQGYQFKEPNAEEVKAMRERFRKEDAQDRVLAWLITLGAIAFLVYLFRGIF